MKYGVYLEDRERARERRESGGVYLLQPYCEKEAK